jgi:F0F1-type ATP synthase membrane subunit c/vacuolar-type H+-ATPase subunit K
MDSMTLIAIASIVTAGLTIALGSLGPALGEARAVATALSSLAQQPDASATMSQATDAARGEIMSDTTASLRRKIGGAGDLQSVVRTMKAVAASSIGQYEYLFVSLFRACAESLASENASRLAAMQRADKNIDELLEDLNGTFHRLRQSGIDEELFDVISGFEALVGR